MEENPNFILLGVGLELIEGNNLGFGHGDDREI